MQFDAVIVGGGPAGLEAALMLGRACRRVLVCDTGEPRNAPATHSHGVFTRDGVPPRELLRMARADLAIYQNVALRSVAVVGAAVSGAGFEVVLEGGERVETRGIIVAAGVRDILPETPGFRELWGTGVFHCPFCHGWELRGQPLAVYGQEMYATHMVYVLKAWTSDVVMVSDGPLTLDDAARTKLARNRIGVHEGRISGLEGDTTGLTHIRFADGSRLARRGLLFHAPTEPRSSIPVQLGAALRPDGMPVLDAFMQTTVPGLFVAGDMGAFPPSVLGAAASGAMAGAGLSNIFALRDAEVA